VAKEPTISVITVVKNGMPHLRHALESLQSQRYRKVQHVVRDANSTDGTSDLLAAAYIDSYARELDAGLYDAVNQGLGSCTGDVIGFLHSDDFYPASDVLERVAHDFAVDPDLQVLLTDVAFVNDQGNAIRRYRSDRFRPSRLRWGWMPAHTGMYVRREVYERVGGYRTDYRIGADFEWVVRAFASQPLKYLHRPFVSMHMRMGGASTSGLASTLTLNKEVLRACRSNGLRTSYLHLLSKYPLKFAERLQR
jgi:glycosyltransferase involved in cell wall biosynthesis